MQTSEIKEVLSEIDEDMLLADGFDEALIGYVQCFTGVVPLYDRRKCIDILVKRDDMTEDGAQEFFEYNVTGAYLGERTPAFATLLRGGK